jgi:CBS domain-containing protein
VERANELILLLNELDDHFARMPEARRWRGFVERLENAARHDQVVRRWRDDLREYAELRNAIVHSRGYPERTIAEPSEESVALLRTIAAKIINPPRLLPDFAGEVQAFAPETPLVNALQFMGRRGFSQAPVLSDGHVSLITSDGIARWLEAQATGDVVSLAETRVEHVLAFEHPDNCVFMKGNATHDEARYVFERELRKGRRRLRAILITKDGNQSGQILGIVTPGDLLE